MPVYPRLPLAFALTFECDDLDAGNWVIDFGSFKPLKAFLQSVFDHKTLVAQMTWHLKLFCELVDNGIADIVMVPAGRLRGLCQAGLWQDRAVFDRKRRLPRVRLVSVMVSEHGGNSAVFKRDMEFDWAALQKLRKESP